MLFSRRYSLMCDLSLSLGLGIVMITSGAVFGMIECAENMIGKAELPDG